MCLPSLEMDAVTIQEEGEILNSISTLYQKTISKTERWRQTRQIEIIRKSERILLYKDFGYICLVRHVWHNIY